MKTVELMGHAWKETTDEEFEERAKKRRATLEKFDEEMEEILLANGWTNENDH
jgi:hypothetical protein